MIRLDLKDSLIKETGSVYLYLSQLKKVLPWYVRFLASWSVYLDFKKGLRQINKKAKVYLELPKLQEQPKYNGYSEEIPKDSTMPPVIYKEDINNFIEEKIED